MIEVDVPGVGVVEFPDGMSEEDVSRSVAGLTSADPGEDFSKGRAGSAASSFMRAGGELFGGMTQGIRRLRQMTGLPVGDEPRSRLGVVVAKLSGAPQIELDKMEALLREEELRSDPLYQFGGNLQAGSREAFPVNPNYAKEFIAGTLPSGAGSIVSGMIGGPIGAGLQQGFSGGESAAQRAVAAGVPQNAGTSFALTAPIVGVSEAVLGGAGRVIPGLRGAPSSLVRRIMEGAAKEGSQEGLEQLGSNLVEQQVVNPNKAVLEGVPQSIAAGAVLGGGMGSLRGIAGNRDGDLPPELQTELSRLGQPNLPSPDEAAVMALDPRSGQWQPLPLSSIPNARSVALESGLREEVQPEGFTPVDRLIAERRFAPSEQQTVAPREILPVQRQVRGDIEGGQASFRQGAEGTASVVPEASVDVLRRSDAEAGPGVWRRTVQWADSAIQEGRKSVGSGVDPTLAAAYAVKAADMVVQGSIKTYEVFRDEFVKRFPDVADMSREVWDRLNADSDSIFKAIDDSSGVDGLNEATRRFGGSVTSLAYRVGEKTDTAQKLARLDEGMARFRKEATDAIKSGDFDKASTLAMKGQFYREAREYATGTGSAGHYLRTKEPGFVPAMERKASEDRFLSSLDRGIEALSGDQAMVMEGVTGLPVWLTRSAARGVLQAVRAAYVGSKSLAGAIDAGVKWMKDQGIKAEDSAMRDWLDSQLQWERISTEADAGPVKTRKSIDRAMASSDVSQPVKELLAQDPASQYRQQIVSPKAGKTSVTDIVDAMTDTELNSASPNSSIYVAQKMELAKRLMRSGDDVGAYQVFSDLAEKGTTFGQLINQFKALKNVDPNYVVRLLNRQLTEGGYDPLTEKQAKDLGSKSKAAIEANDRLEQAKKKWVENPSDENARAAEKLLEDLKVPALELQRAMLAMQPKSLPSVLKAVIQGNLLTPASQVANIAGNMAVMPARAMSDTGAVALDVLDSFIRKRPRQIEFRPVESAEAAARGVTKGFSQVPQILKEGISSVRSGENFRDLQPLKAWVRQFSKEPIVPTRGGKVPASDRAALAVEGTVGIPAAGMLRGLSAGDAPFREKAHAQAVEQQLSLAKVPEAQRPFARRFPELVLEPDAMKRIEDETARAVFQRDSETVTRLNNWIRSQGAKLPGRDGADWADLAFTILAAPYRLTPWNLVGEYLSYTPAGVASVLTNVAKGNKLGAERAAAKVIVGGMAAYAALWLYNKGLLAPSLDDEDEQQKARILSGQVMPADHLNLSGLRRAMSGESAAFKPGDETVGLEKLGIFGSIAHNTANIGRKIEKSPEGQGAGIFDWTFGQVPETAKFALNQSFLKGTATVLDAVRDGNFDDVLRNVENMLVSVPLPNTLSAMSRASGSHKVEIKDDSKLKEFGNIISQRLRVFGAGKDLPVKRGLWGEPLPETPEGSNPLAYHFLDITKGQQVTQDASAVEIYRLWRRYNDPGVIPTPPAASLVAGGQRFNLTPVQQSRLSELVGPLRKSIVDRMVQNPNWDRLSDDQKRSMLERAYESGLKIGKVRFVVENRGELEARGRPAGFVPQ